MKYANDIGKFALNTVDDFDIEAAKCVLMPLSNNLDYFVAVNIGYNQMFSTKEIEIATELVNDIHVNLASTMQKVLIQYFLQSLDCNRLADVVRHCQFNTSLVSVIKYESRKNRQYINRYNNPDEAVTPGLKILRIWLMF